MAALTTLNITEKNANNSLSVTVKVNVTKEGVFTTTLSKEDVDKIHSYGIKLPTNRLGNEGYFQERSYNNDLVGIFERYKDIADGDMEVAMNFIKEAYPFNEETESFIRKKFDMPMPDESKE